MWHNEYYHFQIVKSRWRRIKNCKCESHWRVRKVNPRNLFSLSQNEMWLCKKFTNLKCCGNFAKRGLWLVIPTIGKVFSVSDFSHHRLQNIWGRTIHKFYLPYSCFVAFMFWRMPSKLYQSFIFILPKSKYFCHQLNLSNFVKPQGIEWGQNRLLLPKSGEKIEQCLLQQPQIEESTEKWCPRIWSQIGSKKQPIQVQYKIAAPKSWRP